MYIHFMLLIIYFKDIKIFKTFFFLLSIKMSWKALKLWANLNYFSSYSNALFSNTTFFYVCFTTRFLFTKTILSFQQKSERVYLFISLRHWGVWRWEEADDTWNWFIRVIICTIQQSHCDCFYCFFFADN